MFDLDSRDVDVNGVRLCVAEAGVGGRPLLLIHGFTGSKEDWGDYIDRLAEHGWWVVAPDNRGHGGSDKPEDESAYSFDIFADDALALVDHLGWDTFALLGHSMGGYVAQVMADRFPSRITKLILMDTAHGPVRLVDDELVTAAVHIVRTQGIGALADVMAAAGGSALGSAADERVRAERPGYAEWNNRRLRTVSPAMYGAMLPAFGAGEDRLDALRSLTMPALVICGEQDATFVDPSHRIAAALPNGTLAMIPGAGHSPQFENSAAWWETVSEFLAG